MCATDQGKVPPLINPLRRGTGSGDGLSGEGLSLLTEVDE